MTLFLRRALLMALSMLIMMFSVAGVAVAQEDAGCYPVPPGGCEPEGEAPTCADIIAAIAADDVSLDQNGDGAIDASDLPAECGCAELIEAVAAGTITAADLPEGALADCGCDELIAAIAAGTITAADLPDGALDECGCDELQELVDAGTLETTDLPDGCEEQEQVVAEDDTADDDTPAEGPEQAVLADTGIDGGPMALIAVAGLLAGLSMVVLARTRA